MGLFGLFGKKKKETAEVAEEAAATAPEQAAEQASGSPWPKRFAGFGDWDDDKKKAVGKELLADIGTRFENPKVKDMLDEDDLELRGRVDGVPVRVQYELDMGWVNLEAKCQGAIEDLELEWDLEKIPVEAADDDDDWGDDDEIRVFVGKGVFIEGGKDEVGIALAALASLPTELSQRIIQTMERLRLTRFMIFSTVINVGFDDNSYEMADPVAMVGEVTTLMAHVAQAVGTVTPPVPGQAGAGGVTVVPVNVVTCSYCSSKFNLGAGARCPNCGGAAEG